MSQRLNAQTAKFIPKPKQRDDDEDSNYSEMKVEICNDQSMKIDEILNIIDN